MKSASETKISYSQLKSMFLRYLGSWRVMRKEGNKIGRWNCHACKASFNILSGTMFQGTHLPLQKWFCAIALIVNAKKGMSSCQLARDLNLNQRSAWYMQQRIRAEMATKQGSIMLRGLIEADETYIGGRPRKRNKHDDDKPNPRGTRDAQDRRYRRCGAFREGCGQSRRRSSLSRVCSPLSSAPSILTPRRWSRTLCDSAFRALCRW